MLQERADNNASEMPLLRALRRLPPSFDIFVLTDVKGMASKDRSIGARVYERADQLLSGEQNPSTGSTQDPRIPLQFISATCFASLASALADLGGDVIIDNSMTSFTSEIVPEQSSGLLQAWYEGAQEHDLANGRNPDDVHSDRLVITLQRHGWRRPRILYDFALTRTSPLAAPNKRNAASRSAALILRAVTSIGSWDQLLGNEWSGSAGTKHISPLTAAKRIARVSAEKVARRLIRPYSRGDEWCLAYRTDSSSFVTKTDHAQPTAFKLLTSRSSFLADPCTFRKDGIEHVFFEEYLYAHRRGVISHSQLAPDGSLTDPIRVLERPYHLSYPFVFQAGSSIYMIPESAESHTVDLYRATRFPDQWEHDTTLLKDINAVDVTLFRNDVGWWMFTGVGEEGSYTWDELFVFMADRLSGPWIAHPRNPVKSDPSSARPAGRLFHRRGQLIRPSQNCSRIYGESVTLCAIDVLTKHDFSEHVVDVIPPSWIPGAVAVHTLSTSEQIEVIDCRRSQAFGGSRHGS